MEFVTSQQGIDRIKKFESCRLTAYQDAAGVWTIGYGHTGLSLIHIWRRYKNNPILKDDWGETFDVTVIQVGEKLRMYLSWRSTNSIALYQSFQ